jgi:hypothetical protein
MEKVGTYSESLLYYCKGRNLKLFLKENVAGIGWEGIGRYWESDRRLPARLSGSGSCERMGQKIRDDMGVGPADLVRIFELVDHAFPFFFSMFGDDGAFTVFPAQVHAHACGIGFGVELCTDHGVRKAYGHYCPFEGDMGSFLFDGQDAAAHFRDALHVRPDDLVAAAVDGIEGILEARKKGFVSGSFEHMNGKYPKGCRFPVGDFGDGIMPADELEGVANKKYLLSVGAGDGAIVSFQLPEPAEIGCLPCAVLRVKGATGAAAGDIDIV